MSSLKKRKSLTEKQKNIYDFIKTQKACLGYAPTVREIGSQFDITVRGSYDHIKALEHKGFIKMDAYKSRSIRLLGECNELEKLQVDWVKIPVLGRVAAGPLTYANQEIEEYLTLPMEEYGDGEYFALRIHGDSMIEYGIFERDIVILRKQSYAQDGDIVVALVEDEATLKCFQRKGTKIFLIPGNSRYQPIIVDDVTILGKLTAVYRKY